MGISWLVAAALAFCFSLATFRSATARVMTSAI
jgi:hypothetical protein